MKPFLSICMIVKDEEKVLRRCLESVKDIADEIVIVDTGSVDKTKEIALEFTNMVFEHEWKNDFSEARNFAASKASGEWILALDADEYVHRESFEKFKDELKSNPPKQKLLAVQIVNFVGKNGKNTSLNFHERLYKNDGSVRYYRNIHELLKHKDLTEERGFIQFQVFHTGYMEDIVKEKGKSKRNLSLLISKQDKEPIDYYFIGNEYAQLGELDRAIDFYKKGFKLKENMHSDWVKKLLVRLVNALQSANRNKEALEIVESCEKIYSHLVDFKFLKGKLYFDKGDYASAKTVFEEILEKCNELFADSSQDYLEYLPHKYLGEICERDNLLHLAVHHYTSAISNNDLDDYVWMRLINLLAQHSTLEELQGFIENNCLNRAKMSHLRLIKILLSVSNKEVQKITNEFLSNSDLSFTEKEALYCKILFLNGSNKELAETIGKKNNKELEQLLSLGIFNLIDFILFTIETKNEQYKQFLLELNFDHNIKNLFSTLFGKKKKLSLYEEEFFVSIIKQAYVLNNKLLIDYLNIKKEYLSVQGKIKSKKELRQYNLI